MITGVGGPVDVTAGGTVPGTYGDLVVSFDGTDYTWTYTLNDNALHTNANAKAQCRLLPHPMPCSFWLSCRPWRAAA